MLTTLVVALSLAASTGSAPAIDVPFLPQTDALCGGAAAAMVFRYWGDAHADVQEFAPLVDRRAGGIATRRSSRRSRRAAGAPAASITRSTRCVRASTTASRSSCWCRSAATAITTSS